MKLKDQMFVNPRVIRQYFPEAKFSGMELIFTMDDGGQGFGVSMRGYYEVNEMKQILADLEEANKFFDREIPDAVYPG